MIITDDYNFMPSPEIARLKKQRNKIKGMNSSVCNMGKFSLNERSPITPIPFRCLYSANIENMFMAGRCISVSYIGLGPTRVMLTCATDGEPYAWISESGLPQSVTLTLKKEESISEIRVTLRFDSIKTSQIRLTVRSAMDTDSAVVSEIRVYN